MNHKTILSALTFALWMSPFQSTAQEVPHYVNFQAVLRDDSGNLVEDGFLDLNVKILDQDKDIVYEETQPGVQVVRSAINVMIGEGIEPGSSPAAPTGGVPPAALDPNQGSHFLQIQFGSNLPSEPMELGSVPYAVFAERALKIDFNIGAGDIPPIFLTTSTDFSGDVSGNYNNLQLGAGVVGPGELASAGVTAGSYTHASITVDEDGRITAASSGSIVTDHGALSGLADDDHTQYLERDGSDSMTGSLNMGGNNITNVGNVDGVDVSSLNTTVNNHETRIDALEADNTLNSPTILGPITYDNGSGREYAGITTASNGSVLYSKSLDDNSAYLFRAFVVIINSSQSVVRHYIRDGLLRRDGGVGFEEGDVQTHAVGSGAPRVEWQISGSSAQLVTNGIGAGDGTVRFNGWVEFIKVAEP